MNDNFKNLAIKGISHGGLTSVLEQFTEVWVAEFRQYLPTFIKGRAVDVLKKLSFGEDKFMSSPFAHSHFNLSSVVCSDPETYEIYRRRLQASFKISFLPSYG